MALEELDAAQLGYRGRNWAEIPEAVKQSSISMVEWVHLTPEVTGKDVHDRWREMKIADGWTYGSAYNKEAKTSAIIVPWEKLANFKKPACELIVAMVRALSPLIRAQNG